MKPSRRKLISVLTLVFFFSTMSAFIAYKAGAFGTEFENGVQAMFFPSRQTSFDSPVKDSSANSDVIMPSSKVGIGTIEPKTTKDTTKKQNNANASDQQKIDPTYIYSPKSGPVFEPRKDTQPKQQNQQINNPQPK